MNRRHAPIIGSAAPFDDAGIEFPPGILKKRLFGKPVLRIQRQDLTTRIMALQLFRNHADMLIRPGRAAEGIIRNHHDESAALAHAAPLFRQDGDGLQTRCSAMWHACRSRFIIAFNGTPAHLNIGGSDQPIMRHIRAIGQAHALGLRVNRGDALMHHAHTARGQATIASPVLSAATAADGDLHLGAGHEN